MEASGSSAGLTSSRHLIISERLLPSFHRRSGQPYFRASNHAGTRIKSDQNAIDGPYVSKNSTPPTAPSTGAWFPVAALPYTIEMS